MIGKLTGMVESISNPIIVDVHDVGYVVHVPERLLSTLKATKKITLYIHTHVREDALDLYGFASPEDLALFDLLLTVSGIGPKTALSVIDRGADAIAHAVRTSDVDFFTAIPRLGTKNAQKIIIELKQKLGSAKALDLSGATGETKEITEALMSMGFDRSEIKEITKKLDGDKTMEEKIRHALKLLGK